MSSLSLLTLSRLTLAGKQAFTLAGELHSPLLVSFSCSCSHSYQVIFLSRHTAVSNRHALTFHPIGVLHLKDGESPPHGGKSGWAALPNPRIGPWFRLLKKIAEDHGLVPEFELMWEGLGLGGGDAVGNWNSETGKRKVLLGIGGGHYAPRHMDIVLKENIWVGHLLSGYSLPMEDPTQTKPNPGENQIGGNWRQSFWFFLSVMVICLLCFYSDCVP